MQPILYFALKICAARPICPATRSSTMPSREYAKLTKTFPLSATRSQPLGPVRTIAVTGGKGGVGKTNVSANL
ncbi:MAG: MinD/ParA family protein, partial [Thermomonas sp.]